MDAQSKSPEEDAQSTGQQDNPAAQTAGEASSELRPQVPRRSIIGGVADGAKFIDDTRDVVAQRPIDKSTSILLGIALMSSIVLLLMPNLPAAALIFLDLIFASVLATFMLCRFGIVRALTPRQAVIVWELIFGATLFGAFLAIHLGFIMRLISAGFSSTP